MEKTDWAKLVKLMTTWQWVVVAAGAILVAGVWVTNSSRLPPQIPLFYSRPWGEEQLAGKYFLWLPLIIAGGTAGIVTLIVKKLKPDNVLSAILTGAAIITEVILILAVLHTIILVR